VWKTRRKKFEGMGMERRDCQLNIFWHDVELTGLFLAVNLGGEGGQNCGRDTMH